MSVKVCTLDISNPSVGKITQLNKIALITWMKSPDAPWESINLGLYKNTTPLDPDSVLADVELPGWTGYAIQPPDDSNPVTPSGVYGATLEYVSVDWAAASDADVTLQGIYITNTANTLLLGWVPFDAPLPVEGVTTITVVFVILWQ